MVDILLLKLNTVLKHSIMVVIILTELSQTTHWGAEDVINY